MQIGYPASAASTKRPGKIDWTAAAFALFVLVGLWYGYPLVAAIYRRDAAGGRAHAKASGQRS
jgi:hypothetical protein